ncbi:uncharacterized protein LOC124209749 [Daphnia pulex]|uniref:uncharacterized protein LOC124209749 n=1 Tax=Daphnia pulex TaxID=6669 RepID=UPI001EDD86CF|nr:uncharacterized protein LOC124209749 [Daphnia pulex]
MGGCIKVLRRETIHPFFSSETLSEKGYSSHCWVLSPETFRHHKAWWRFSLQDVAVSTGCLFDELCCIGGNLKCHLPSERCPEMEIVQTCSWTSYFYVLVACLAVGNLCISCILSMCRLLLPVLTLSHSVQSFAADPET